MTTTSSAPARGANGKFAATGSTDNANGTSRARLQIPSKGSTLHALVASERKRSADQVGLLSDTAAFYKAHLPKVIIARGGARTQLLGMDAKVMANRVIRPLQNIARLEQKLATQYAALWMAWQVNVANVQTHDGGVPKIDVDG